jgi:asparagine synthase (glutamine-hydrolysing)
MCGLVGFIDFKSPQTSPEVLQKMQKALGHRGPNDRGHSYSPAVGLAHTRLSILDLSAKAAQPMSRGTLTIVYNGEVYNYEALRRELSEAGYTFNSNSDTEVILAAYQAWGKAALTKFDGMFALAIYDRSKQELFLARDRLGVKPLFYYKTPEHFLFASEIKAIACHPGFRKRVCSRGLRDYLQFGYINGEETIWDGCRRLLPGQSMTVDCRSGNVAVETFWNPRFIPREDGTFETAKRRLKTVLTEEFKDSLVSDVPVGACISGGVDSNVLIGILAKELGVRLKTYSLASNEAKYNENTSAAAVAKFFNLEHRSITLDANNSRELFLQTVAHYDEPFADQNFLSYRVIARQAQKDGVPVLLSGAGGDELFFGYPAVIRSAGLRPLFFIPQVLRGLWPLSLSHSWNYVYKGAQLLKEREYLDAVAGIIGNGFLRSEVDRLLPEDFKEEGPNYFSEVFHEKSSSQDTLVEKLMRCDLMCFLPSNVLAISDVSTMAEGVEMRVPYLNNKIVDCALEVPVSVKRHNGRLKALLRSIEADYLPENLLLKEKRGFYPFVKSVWLKNHLSDLTGKYLSPENFARQGIFNYDHYLKMVSLPAFSRVSVANKIWNMLIFQIWAEYHLN